MNFDKKFNSVYLDFMSFQEKKKKSATISQLAKKQETQPLLNPLFSLSQAASQIKEKIIDDTDFRKRISKEAKAYVRENPTGQS